MPLVEKTVKPTPKKRRKSSPPKVVGQKRKKLLPRLESKSEICYFFKSNDNPN
nr:MAG TPA: hypothetical protein [Caudoviricetes sp.]